VRFSNGYDGYKLVGGGLFWGFWDYAGWHPAVPGGGWTSAAAAAEPPVPPPGAPAVANYGVDVDQVAREQRPYILNGAEVSREVAFAAVGDVLTDDSARWNLTLVGDGTRAMPDVQAQPAATRDRLHVQTYQAGAWEVGQFGLRPGVTLRKPAVGRVGAEVETIDPAGYTREKLADLLLELDGKRPPKVTPKPPEPKKPDDPPPDAPPASPAAGQGLNPALLFVSSLLATLLTLTRKKVTP
jgi:hypothetical protein